MPKKFWWKGAWQCPPLRRIVRQRNYQTINHPHGAYSVELELECGHKTRVKFSKAPKHRARCLSCATESSDAG